MPDDSERVDMTVKEVLERTSDLATQLKESVDELKVLMAGYEGGRESAE